MDIPVFFKPDGVRASAAAGMMKRRLALSLTHILERAENHIEVPAGSLDRLLGALDRNARISPDVFGIYNDILAAVEVNDMRRVASLFRQLAASDHELPGSIVTRLDEVAMGGDRFGRYLRYVGDGGDTPLNLVAPPEEEFTAVCGYLDRARSILETAVPECACEVDALVSEVVIADVTPSESGLAFDGVSTFCLWGALFLNPRTHAGTLDALDSLVHEATHELLFTFSVDEPLAMNPLDERYSSPLRMDPRPMDGVYHAAYVLARMHYASSRLHASGVLDEGDRAVVASRIEHYGRLAADGLATVRRYGRLTDTGEAVLRGAEDYMAEVMVGA